MTLVPTPVFKTVGRLEVFLSETVSFTKTGDVPLFGVFLRIYSSDVKYI